MKRRAKMVSSRIKESFRRNINREPDREHVSHSAWKRARHLIGLLFLLAVLSRLSYLGLRAFHHDESLDAWFSLRYLDGTYKGYDPVYHGPLRFYLTAAFFWLFGQSDSIARLLPAISGLVCWRLGLQNEAKMIVLVFSSLPASASAYVMAHLMGGDAELMASILGIQTLFSVFLLSGILIYFTLL